ncbi:MAG: hypothetical protein JO111_16015 [Caulobacteraceae bacterium]|nr:hypothetical protein [Caulobacteraceae bacterium]
MSDEATAPESHVMLAGDGGSGSHSAYFEDGTLVVEWYDHGPHAPYESANMLKFDREQQAALADALGFACDERTGAGLLRAIQRRFASYFEVSEFVERAGLTYAKAVDFLP